MSALVETGTRLGRDHSRRHERVREREGGAYYVEAQLLVKPETRRD